MKLVSGTRIGIAGLFILLMLGIGASRISAAEPVKSFKDVPSKHWSYSYVQKMIDNGIISGFADGTFHPGDQLTREQFASLLTLTLDLDLVTVSEPTFSDVKSTLWSYPYIETVKDYLEGYSLPIGKPFFDPKAVVTREDVAVALVKAMKIDTNIENAEEVIRNKVSDYKSISPGLAVYVAAAIENNLISGYEDGTFKPRVGLDRSSAAALLSKVIESPLLPPLKQIDLAVQAPESVETNKVHFEGTVSSDTKLTINGKSLAYSEGTFSRDISLSEGEGDYEFEFKAVQPNGRYKSVSKSINFTMPDPKLAVDVPATTEKKSVVVTGNVQDINDANPVVTVNGSPVVLSGSGDWKYEVSMKEGLNVITVAAVNKYDKSSTVDKNVQFTVKPPELALEEIPSTQYTPKLRVAGKVSDLNDANPKVYLNSELVSSYGSLEKTMTLVEGENVMKFEAVNSFGKKTVVTKKVNYVILPPTITISDVADTSLDKTVTIKATSTDLNDDSPTLYLDDLYMGVKSFSTSVNLKEGENIFTIKAKNKLGKQYEMTKKITYLILPPEISIDPIPEFTDTKTISIKVKATDYNDSTPSLYLNGTYAGAGSFTQKVTLQEGENTITIKATNYLSKTKEVVKKITFTSPAPVLTVNSLPETVTAQTLAISAGATDTYDSYPKMYLNGQYISTLTFNKSVTLTEGENVFEIMATNNAGKSTKVIKRVTYVIPSSSLNVGEIPTTTSSPQLTLTASATDPGDSSPKLYLNGQYVASGSFSKTVTLVEGVNTFEFKAVNSAGKTSDIIVRTITYAIPGPTLTVGDMPETTTTSKVMLTASAIDPGDAAPKLYLNGQYIGITSLSAQVDLIVGENVFEFKAVNNRGKETIIVRKVIYQPVS